MADGTFQPIWIISTVRPKHGLCHGIRGRTIVQIDLPGGMATGKGLEPLIIRADHGHFIPVIQPGLTSLVARDPRGYVLTDG